MELIQYEEEHQDGAAQTKQTPADKAYAFVEFHILFRGMGKGRLVCVCVFVFFQDCVQFSLLLLFDYSSMRVLT